jgi:hypothetical protein
MATRHKNESSQYRQAQQNQRQTTTRWRSVKHGGKWNRAGAKDASGKYPIGSKNGG